MARVTRTPGPVGPERLQVILKDMDGVRGKVGWFESARYPNGTPVAMVAAIHEFGAPSKSIPPRPFMRPTIKRCRAAWAAIAEQGSKAVLAGTTTMEAVMTGIGLNATGEIQRSITEVVSPPLSPSTVRARGRRRSSGNATAKPLIDTGHMIQTVTSVVEKTR